MSNELESERDPDQPMIYQFRIKGHLNQQWMNWFEGLTITLKEDGNTLIAGLVVDQAALHGLLKKVRDLGLPLLSVNSVVACSQDRRIINMCLMNSLAVSLISAILIGIGATLTTDLWALASIHGGGNL